MRMIQIYIVSCMLDADVECQFDYFHEYRWLTNSEATGIQGLNLALYFFTYLSNIG